MKNYCENAKDCGMYGKSFEMAIKEYLNRQPILSKAGRVDLRRAYKNYEVKTNAGEIGNADEKPLRGVSLVIYAPYVCMSLPIEKQEAFVIDRAVFLEILDECGLIREKVSTHGDRKLAIQTVWNNAKNAPHSKKKYEMLLDLLYERCEMTLEEWLTE